jgi:hypothetical protein
MQGWDMIPEPHASRLLDSFRKDATDTSDWFHPRAKALARELAKAVRKTAQHQPEKELA